MQVFPVAGGARFSNDWGAPRAGSRGHQGNDLFAAEGTPVLAVDDGRVRFGIDPLGGNVANLRADDGTRYYYAHLRDLGGAVGELREVRVGDQIGTVGRTGNAKFAAPHLHFEAHPRGGAAVNPYPSLRQAAVRSAPNRGTPAGRWLVPLFAGAALLAVYTLAAPAKDQPKALRRLRRQLVG